MSQRKVQPDWTGFEQVHYWRLGFEVYRMIECTVHRFNASGVDMHGWQCVQMEVEPGDWINLVEIPPK